MSSPAPPGTPPGQGPMRFVGLGVQLAVTLLLLVWLGQWVDRKLGTGGLATLAGAFLAFAATMVTLVRALRQKGGDGQ